MPETKTNGDAKNDAARWAQATRLAEGVVDDQWRSGRRRKLVIAAAIVVPILIAIGIAGALLSGRHGQHHHHASAPLWREIFALALIVIGFGIVVLTLVRLLRTGQLRRNYNSPLLALSRRDRRSVFKQIRGKEPVQEDQLTVTRAVAVLIQAQARLSKLYVGLLLLWAGELVQQTKLVYAIYFGISIVLFPFLIIVQRRTGARAAEFLTQHPAPVD